MILSCIVATSRNGVIGDNGMIPWKVKSDMLHFRDYTKGKTLLMGRKTFESIPSLLDDRVTIILSGNPDALEECIKQKRSQWKERNPEKEPPVVAIATSLEELFASDFLLDTEELVVCGGSSIYELLYDHCDKFVHTLIDVKIMGDSHFLKNRRVDFKGDWVKSDKESIGFTQSDGDEYRYYINTYYRKNVCNVYNFKDKKRLNKLELLRRSFLFTN